MACIGPGQIYRDPETREVLGYEAPGRGRRDRFAQKRFDAEYDEVVTMSLGSGCTAEVRLGRSPICPQKSAG